MPKKNIAIFASGEGSNAQRIIDHFRDSEKARVALIVSNNPGANVLKRSEKEGIPTALISRAGFYENDALLSLLRSYEIDLIVLAGFLWMIPSSLIQAYPDRILNLHPALLPKFGGKGMYGLNVHRAVIEAAEKESGITIHLVNDNYDEGRILAQFSCPVGPGESPESLAQKIHQLEHLHFPAEIERYLEACYPS